MIALIEVHDDRIKDILQRSSYITSWASMARITTAPNYILEFHAYVEWGSNVAKTALLATMKPKEDILKLCRTKMNSKYMQRRQ